MMETVRIDKDSVEYPARLREIPDPPGQLYCTGNIELLNERSIAVVGARKNTVYGKNVALMIGRRLAESGLVVTSGLALGNRSTRKRHRSHDPSAQPQPHDEGP